MAKRKKKPSQHQQQKLADAHRRNQFYYKLNYLITTITGDPSVYKLLPDSELRPLYTMHFQAPRVLAAPGSTINPQLFEQIRHYILRKLKIVTTTYTPQGLVVTLDMFLTVGMTLYSYLLVLPNDRFPAAIELKKRLAPVLQTDEENDTDILGTLLERMFDPVEMIPILINNFEDTIYWITIKADADNIDVRPVPYCRFTVHTYKPKKIPVVVEGNTRPAYEVCWGDRNEGIIKVATATEKLKLPADKFPVTMPVYVQAHALHRLFERIDCIASSLLQLHLYNSLFAFNYSRGAHNTFLVTYKFGEKKLGYLVASVKQGVLLVHTFLLSTHNGTPEGNRLASLTKLNKLDMQYLTIDKLSAFYTSDIADNPEVKKLFIDAGCADLFDIDPLFLHEKTTEPKKPLADKILNYLNLTTSDDDLETYRKEQMPG